MPEHSRRAPRILLVDDEEWLCQLGSKLLSAMGFEVMTANNGHDALRIIHEEERVDLIVMDLFMPEMGGYEAYLRLRLIDPRMPVVLCSGYIDGKIEAEIEHDHYAGLLEKPYRPEQLRSMLQKMLSMGA